MRKRQKMLKTRVSERLFEAVKRWAEENEVSIYEATRQLIERGLETRGIQRLIEDDDLLLLAVKYRLKDSSFRGKLFSELSREPEFRKEILRSVADIE